MAYIETSLARLGSAPLTTGVDKARSVYLYPTADALSTALASGYFNNARGRLVKGDLIFIVASQNGTPTRATTVVTSVPSSGNVTLNTTVDNLTGNAAITSLTAATGTTGDTVSAVGASYTEATLNNNFKVLSDKVNAIIATLRTAGIIVT